MIKVTRDVVIDLLPAYFAGEASEETRRVVEGYFEQDPEFARMAQRMNDKLLQTMPVQLPEEHKVKTLNRTRTTLMWQMFVLALLFILFMAALAAGVFLVIR